MQHRSKDSSKHETKRCRLCTTSAKHHVRSLWWDPDVVGPHRRSLADFPSRTAAVSCTTHTHLLTAARTTTCRFPISPDVRTETSGGAIQTSFRRRHERQCRASMDSLLRPERCFRVAALHVVCGHTFAIINVALVEFTDAIARMPDFRHSTSAEREIIPMLGWRVIDGFQRSSSNAPGRAVSRRLEGPCSRWSHRSRSSSSASASSTTCWYP